MKNTDFQLERALGFHVNRAAFLMTEEIARRFKELGFAISAQDFGILQQIYQQKELSQAEVIKLTLRDKTTITRRIDGLVKKNLVERFSYEHDRRSVFLQLSPDGKKALPKLINQVKKFQQEAFGDVSESDKQITLNTLQHIIHNLS